LRQISARPRDSKTVLTPSSIKSKGKSSGSESSAVVIVVTKDRGQVEQHPATVAAEAE
jgi:hypothetical protein